MNTQISRPKQIGLCLLGLLSLADIATPLLTDGETPPYAIAALVAVLGLVSLFLVVRALRDPAKPIRLLIGLRVVSALSAVPAFLVDDVPEAAKLAALFVVLATVVAVLLVSSSRPQEVTS